MEMNAMPDRKQVQMGTRSPMMKLFPLILVV